MRKNLRKIFLTCAVISFGVLANRADADFIIEIERINDTTAILTGVGTFAPTGNPINTHLIAFDNPFVTNPNFFTADNILTSSTLSIGSTPINFAYDVSSSFNFFGNGHAGFYIGNLSGTQLVPGSGIAGSMAITLTGGVTFASVGSTGTIVWGTHPGNVAGTWEITAPAAAVPEPSSLALAGLGGIGLIVGAIRRRRAAAA